MKYIVEAINKAIELQKPSADKQLRIRLSGFEDVRIYKEVCDNLERAYKNLKIEARLATEKFDYFLNGGEHREELAILKRNNHVAGEKSLTYYRNLTKDAAQIIVLMGTEAVDDQGGLSDLFYIDPSKLAVELQGNYSSIVIPDYQTEDKKNGEKTPEADLINKLYKDLFSLVPLNICKLSDMVDSWGRIENVESFAELFYRSLPEWGLCKDEIAAQRISRTKTKRNLLQSNYDFITRKAFRKMNGKQYSEYLKKISDYPNHQKAAFPPMCEEWANQGVNQYSVFATTLEEYIGGKNLVQNRALLQKVDFSIINDIINLKDGEGRGKKEKEKKILLHGSPLSVFTHAIYALLGTESEQPYNEININIQSIELTDAIDPESTDDEDKQLERAWRRVCWAAGGVFEYIQSRGIEVDEIPIDFKVTPNNIFSPRDSFINVQEGNISVASANKKLNKIVFTLTRNYNREKVKDLKDVKCEWTFSSSEGWLRAFDGICRNYDDWAERKKDAILPLFKIEKYESLVSSKSEEEFLDSLENSALICNFDILSYIKNNATDYTGQNWLAEFYMLGAAFVEFCQSISENGFYGDIVKIGESKVHAFIDCYVKLGNKIIKSNFSSSMEWVFSSYIHAFAVEQNTLAIERDELQSSCIIPPFHPAVLQKMVDQSVFLYDGCREILMNKTADTPLAKICDAIDGLEEMSGIHEGLDIFPGKRGKFFGTTKAFANYCICGNINTDVIEGYSRIRAMDFEKIRKKDAVYDDDFSVASYKRLDESARMYRDVIESYLKALPNARFNISVTIINPNDLQPVVAAIHDHIQSQKSYLETHSEEYADTQRISVRLNILVTPENKGGRSYLTYWVNSFFTEDENVDVKVYLNEYDSTDSLFKILGNNVDILFLQDVLMLDKLEFMKDTTDVGVQISECRFPIVFKPIPVHRDSIKRRIELTQKQFSASTIHSQVVSYAKDYDTYGYQKSSVTKALIIDRERRNLILRLHSYSNWVVCVDGGLDGALLRDDISDSTYSIIGFSTGKGRQGQYNLTITARASIIDSVNVKLKARLKQAFQWDNKKIDQAAYHCMDEASRLDGVSLLSAINPRDFKINEFLAYVLTAAEVRKIESSEKNVRVIIHLDSYQHWFSHEKVGKDESRSRPDFLLIDAKVNEDNKIELHATVIECKLAQYASSVARKSDARKQVVHGIERLSTIFDPNSKSIRRRYWYAQLYRALSFAQITFCSADEDFSKYADGMRAILEGNFDITWKGCVMGYWKDYDAESEIVTDDPEDSRIKFYDIPQQIIQRLLLGDDTADITFANIDDPDESEMDEEYYVPEDDIDYEDIYVPEYSEESIKQVELPKNEPEIVVIKEPEKVIPDTKIDVGTGGIIKAENKPIFDEKAPENDNPKSGDMVNVKKNLEDVRVYIGKDRAGNKVYWEFGHPKMANRHLLITGTSGQGKTYSIQTMLKELSESGVPAVIFDYTEGFRPDQLAPAFTEALEGKINQKIIYYSGVPIDPFVRHEIEIAGMKMREKPADVSQRIANIFSHVYKFGDQQFSAVYQACRAGIELYGDSMSMRHFQEQLEESKNPAAKTVLSKMAPFLDSAEFVKDPDFDWGKVIHSDGTVTVIQLTNFVREIQVIITEMMLWDAWHYNKKFGNKDTPFVVVLDEAQNLSHKESSPSAIILTEGRKFGWSAWFATQSLKVLDNDEVIRLQQAAFKLYFKPTDEEITTTAKSIDPVSGASAWTGSLKSLRKGQAIVTGDRVRLDGSFGNVKPSITSIASFEERKNETNEH